MAARSREENPPVAPVVRVAPLGELKVYMVTEEEIDKLGGGSPGSIFLNFAIALLSLSASFLLTLLTTTIGAIAVLVFFICSCLICFIAGLICSVLSWQTHVSTRAVVGAIKDRMPPPPPISQEVPDSTTAADAAVARQPPPPSA